MTTFAEVQAADRRLRILRLLVDSNGYSSNEHSLAAALEYFGHEPSRDLMRTDPPGSSSRGS